MTTNLSFWHLFLEASFIVKLVMGILLGLSIFSWACIIQRRRAINNAYSMLNEFEGMFWSGIDLGGLYGKLTVKGGHLAGLDAIFVTGFKEFVRMHKHSSMEGRQVIESSARLMRVKLSQEVSMLEKNLPFLASVQSMSPYIGLFGTVWGVMNSFTQLGTVQQATLSMVAPGIAEALIATAMGLVAAIPAGIAYNRYINNIDNIARGYENFIDEFVGLLQRKLYSNRYVTQDRDAK